MLFKSFRHIIDRHPVPRIRVLVEHITNDGFATIPSCFIEGYFVAGILDAAFFRVTEIRQCTAAQRRQRRSLLPDIPFKLDRIGPRNDLSGRRLRSSQSDKFAIITTEIIGPQINPSGRWARRGPQIHKHDIRNPIVNNFNFNITVCFIRPIKLVE
ncbi:hypothetical protein D3C71_1356710 [compost metagenome]